MKLSEMASLDEVIEQNRQDAEFVAEWDKSERARALATAVVRYRAEHGLTQRGLAAATGLTQPAVARLELGEALPNLPTLVKLSRADGLAFILEVQRGSAALSAA
jgi:DNA-binding XRE family transcriptional regulator